jgi:hypothetical protein
MVVRLSGLCAGCPLLPGGFLVLISVRGRVDPRPQCGQKDWVNGNIQWPHRESNLQPAGMWHSVSTNYTTACPHAQDMCRSECTSPCKALVKIVLSEWKLEWHNNSSWNGPVWNFMIICWAILEMFCASYKLSEVSRCTTELKMHQKMAHI